MFKHVITTGAFNLLHPGHIKFLESAKMMGEELTVFLDSDERNEELKPDKAIFSYKERKMMLAALPFVDNILRYEGLGVNQFYHSSFENTVANSRGPRLFVKGADYTMDTLDQEQLRLLREHSWVVAFLEYDDKYSTTKVINDLITKKGPGRV